MVSLLTLIVIATLSGNPSGVFSTYTPREYAATKAPRGYKPFYISHYGRHGSRYHAYEGYFAPGVDALKKAESAGLLTPRGDSLLADMQKVWDEHKDMYGMLSPKGAEEHRGVSNRMFHRFRKVFRGKDRRLVRCASTNFPRTITSMSNFATTLKGNNPRLEIEYRTGQRYHDALLTEYVLPESLGEIIDSLLLADCIWDDLYAGIFSDPAAAGRLVEDPYSFVCSVFETGAICGCVDYLGVDIFKYFSERELQALANIRSDLDYSHYGNSLETGDYITPVNWRCLQDIVTRADDALEQGSNVAADLRFGHDSGIMPLMSLIGIEGNDVRHHVSHSYEQWPSYLEIPMCSNFQMVFYRNRKGTVLVKMLYNEGETSIPALSSFKGPYYKWEDVRSYFMDRIEWAQKMLK